MLFKIIDINSISSVQQNIGHNIYGIQEIQYEEKSIGNGAVGSVFKVINIDGKTEVGLLLKIISEPDFIKKSYETISILHDKLNKYQTKSGVPAYIEVPELNGLPFIAFKGKIEGSDEEIAGYLMKDLVYYGYSDLGSEDWNRQKYITEIGFEEKLYLCYQFSRGVNFLHEQKFIHSDLKEYSIFINQNRPQLSIIDYDGGFHYDKQNEALTIGAITSWASSYWRKIIGQGKSSKDVSFKERLDEENWVLASGLFELLFGYPPFYFLKSIENDSIDNYLKENTWPNFKDNSPEINTQNIGYHKIILNAMASLKKEGLKPLIDSFSKVFNEGHSKVSKRLTPKQWKDILFEINKKLVGSPKIENFISDKNIISYKNEDVEFKWTANFYRAIYLDGKLIDPLINSTKTAINDGKDVEIRAINDFGEHSETISISANKVDPLIKHFGTNIIKRSDLTPVLLDWQTEFCNAVTIERVGDQFPPIGSVEVNPLEKTKFILNAIGFFDQKVIAEVEVDVETAKIISFRYEINIEKGIDNIDLFWETESATEVEIQPKIGKVTLSGETYIGIIDKTEFTLSATGYFNTTKKTIEAQPFPIPIIKGIFVPTPILNIETIIPKELLEIPVSLSNSLKVDFSNSLSYNNPTPPFVDFNQSQIIRKSVHQKNEDPKAVLNLFDNLFKRVNKK